jgi:Spy/CpxP family protein refolding chaperone
MRRIGIALAMAGLLIAPVARADQEKGKGGDRGGKAAKALELTGDQQAKLKAIGEDQKKTQTPLWQALGDQMKELKQLVDGKADDAKLVAKLNELKKTRGTIEENRKKFDAQKEAVLTPMQRAKTALWLGWKAKQAIERGQGMKSDKKRHHEEGEEKEEK